MFLLPTVAFAETINFDASAGGFEGLGDSSGDMYQAMKFTPTHDATSLTLTLFISKHGSPTDDTVLEIQSDSGGLPSGTAVDTGSVVLHNAGLAPQSTSATQAFPAISACLTAGTPYWFVLHRTGAADSSNTPYLGANNPAIGTHYFDGPSNPPTNDTTVSGAGSLVTVEATCGATTTPVVWPLSPFGTASTTWQVVDYPNMDFAMGWFFFFAGLLVIISLFKRR